MFGKNKTDELWAHIEGLQEIAIGREEEFRKQLEKLQEKLLVLESAKLRPEDHGARLAEIEVKMAKLWGLLIKMNERTGEEKLTKHAKRFGGMGFKS